MQLVNAQTGEPEEIDQDNVAQALTQGTHGIANDAVLDMLDPHGNLVGMKATYVPQALKTYGYSIPTKADITEAQNKAQYGEGLGNAATAFTLGALRGGTLGLSDVAGRAIGGKNYQDLASNLQKYNPASSISGEAVGAVTPALLAPEGVLGKTLAKGAISEAAEYAPTALLAKGGKAVTEGLEGVLGIGDTAAGAATSEVGADAAKQGALAGLGKVGAAAAGAAAEGAVYGGAHSVSEWALGDPELTAGKVWANIGGGALIGGALGGMVEGLSLGVPASIGKAREAANDLYESVVGKWHPTGDLDPAEAAMGVAGTGEKEGQTFIPGPGAKAYAQASSTVSGQSVDEIMQNLANRDWASLTPKEASDLRMGFTKGLQDHWTTTQKAIGDVEDAFRGEGLQNLLNTIDPKAPQDHYLNLVGSVEGLGKEMAADKDLYPRRFSKFLEEQADGLQRRIASESSPYEIYTELNDFKGRLDDKIASSGFYKGGMQSVEGSAQDSVAKLLELRSQIKNALEDQGVWGEAGSAQAELNDALSSLKKAQKPIKSEFQLSRFPDKIDDRKVIGFFNQINNEVGKARQGYLKDYLDSSNNFFDTVEKTYKRLPNAEDMEAGFQKQRQFAESQRDTLEKVKSFAEASKEVGYGKHTDWAHAMLGSVFGPKYAIAKAVVDNLANPAMAIKKMAAVEKVVQKTTKTMNKISSDIFTPVAEALEQGKEVIKGAKELSEEPEARKKDIEKKIKNVEAMVNDPEGFSDKLALSAAPVHEFAPNIAQNLQMTAARGMQFLSGKIPRSVTPDLPFDRPYKPPMSEYDKFGRYYDAVYNPMNVMKQIATGRLRSEGLEALQTVHPALYQEMQKTLLDHMTTHMAKGAINIHPAVKMALSDFMGTPLASTANPNFALQNQQILAGAAQQKAQQEAQPIKSSQKGLSKLSLAERSKTFSQQRTSLKEA